MMDTSYPFRISPASIHEPCPDPGAMFHVKRPVFLIDTRF